MHRLHVRLASILAVSVFALGLTAGCSALGVASREDLDKARQEAKAGDDGVRADMLAASKAQNDAYTVWLAEHPGDFDGASRAALAAGLKVNTDTKAKAEATPLPPLAPADGGLLGYLAAALAAITGGGGIGAWLLKRHDAAPFVGSKGQAVSEAALVDAVFAPKSTG